MEILKTKNITNKKFTEVGRAQHRFWDGRRKNGQTWRKIRLNKKENNEEKETEPQRPVGSHKYTYNGFPIENKQKVKEKYLKIAKNFLTLI